jgi:transcriptional regulator with XRE-family HTH domain
MDLDKCLINISRNLLELRNEKGLTQFEVSHNLNMERRGYQKLEYCESKDIKLSTILKIIEFYNINFEDLIKEK